MTRAPAPQIVIVGGGVAAVEAVIALRALAGPRPAITLLTPVAELVQRPASVAAREDRAFVVPSASGWTLPAYELAIMAAVELRSSGHVPAITVVTAEPAPLWVFGREAGAAIRDMLGRRGIALRTGARALVA